MTSATARRRYGGPDDTMQAVNGALTRFLPLELDRLRTALGAVPADIHSAPSNVARDWLLPDGQARVEVLPVATAHNSQGLHKFVAEVSAVAPDAGGTAVTVIATSDTIISAFRSAAIAAVLAIAVLLLVALRRLRYAALVLAPLLLSAALTMLVMVLLRFPLNYANIIPLLLLLGVGVSFNIYFVMNWRAGRREMLASATARAVAFSALTTGTAFGSLALSGHPGHSHDGGTAAHQPWLHTGREPHLRPCSAGCPGTAAEPRHSIKTSCVSVPGQRARWNRSV